MRRRVSVALVALVVVHLATPRQAAAWFGWLDELSGPGKFYGAQIDVRMKCLGAGRSAKPRPKGSHPGGEEPQQPELTVVGVKLSRCAPAADVRRLASLDLEGRVFWTRDHPSVGDLKVFADGHPIFLVSGGASLSYRPLYHLFDGKGRLQLLDVADVGIGAGPALFSSKGIDDFGRFLVEPRVEFHVPSSWVPHNRGRSVLWSLLPTLRFTKVVFLEGFKDNAFNAKLPVQFANLAFTPTRDKARDISGPEAVNSWTVFIEARIGR